MVGSVNTNVGAQIALQNLNLTSNDLANTQKVVSTGLKVSDALDNGAVFAIAQGLRSDIKAISTVNGQLGAAKGLLSVATAAANGVQETLVDIRSVLVQLSDQNVTGNARLQLNSQYLSLYNAVTNYVAGANYNGSNLLAKLPQGYVNSIYPPGVYVNYIEGSTSPFTTSIYRPSNVSVIQDISANQYNIPAQTTTDFQSFVINRLTTFSDATGASTLLTGGFVSAQNFVGSALNSLAASSHFIENQITFNNAVTDATTVGLGSLVDGDLAKESAKLQALQIKQQLGTQSLGIANQAPQNLLGLFR